MIAILDLGVGNLSSVRSGFQRVGTDTVVVADEREWEATIQSEPRLGGVILPGVGAFADAMEHLRASGLDRVVHSAVSNGRPVLGICLGMQMLFSRSEEHGTHAGLDLIAGSVVRFPSVAKVPHMGWNSLSVMTPHPVLAGVHVDDFVYFVHSYYAVMDYPAQLLAAADYAGVTVPAVVARGNLIGSQFHPEKSGPVGEQILRNFADISRRWNAEMGVSTHDKVSRI